jgi:hypothetical protein
MWPNNICERYFRLLRIDNLSGILLLHKGEILPLQGKLEDVPVVDGDEIMVVNLLQDEQVQSPPLMEIMLIT